MRCTSDANAVLHLERARVASPFLFFASRSFAMDRAVASFLMTNERIELRSDTLPRGRAGRGTLEVPGSDVSIEPCASGCSTFKIPTS